MNTLARTVTLEPLLSADEAATYLGMSAGTLQNWRVSGRFSTLLPYIKVGRAVRYKASTLAAFVESQQRGHTA